MGCSCKSRMRQEEFELAMSARRYISPAARSILILSLLFVGLVAADFFGNLSLSGNMGEAKGRTAYWWENSKQIPDTRDGIIEWATARSMPYRYNDLSQGTLILILDRMTKTQLGIVCFGVDVVGQFTFDQSNRVSGKKFWAQSNCVFDREP